MPPKSSGLGRAGPAPGLVMVILPMAIAAMLHPIITAPTRGLQLEVAFTAVPSSSIAFSFLSFVCYPRGASLPNSSTITGFWTDCLSSCCILLHLLQPEIVDIVYLCNFFSALDGLVRLLPYDWDGFVRFSIL